MLAGLAHPAPKNLEAHFDVVSNVPGVIHISPTDDISEWTALGILDLLEHLFIGAFLEEMLRAGMAL